MTEAQRRARETEMITFQLIGLAFAVMFFGAMINGIPARARR